ncbi:MAG: tyrosine-protein kinase family protein [Desulfobacteraceae bacterium]|nr:MAG: tyrosine-protein kinase family protein [Desulfobacteraceae bacterium]
MDKEKDKYQKEAQENRVESDQALSGHGSDESVRLSLNPHSRNSSEPQAQTRAKKILLFLKKYLYRDIWLNSPKLKIMMNSAYRYAEIHRIKEQVVEILQKRNQKCIMITSPHDGAGNTSLVSILGYNAAFFNKMKVLLVDLNMRKPQLHVPFGLEQETGFTDFVAGTVKWQDLLKSTELGELKIITAGRPNEQLSFNLNRPMIGEMIREMKAAFDLIILDTSPVLINNRNNVEPVYVSKAADLVLVVVQDKITSKADLRNSVAAFIDGDSEVHGIIYNQQFHGIFGPFKQKKRR